MNCLFVTICFVVLPFAHLDKSQKISSSSSVSSSSSPSSSSGPPHPPPSMGSRKECALQELQKCMHFLLPVTEGNDSSLPINRHELKIICDDLRVGVKCFDRHTRNCFSQEQTMVYKDLLNPAKDFISQLCEDGPIQSEFLKHASCYRNLSVDVDKCAVKYKDAVKTSASASENKNTDKSMKLSCCALRDFLQCKYQYVGRDCGKEAESFMRGHLGRMTNHIMENHCAAFTYGSDSCGGTQSPSDFSSSNQPNINHHHHNNPHDAEQNLFTPPINQDLGSPEASSSSTDTGFFKGWGFLGVIFFVFVSLNHASL